MSAIAGIYNLNNEEPVAREQINGMMSALEKFPADDIQVWQKGPVFLGCHAQWITSESIGEQLPFYDSQRKCAITADCIIDNREELFEALQVPRDDQKTIPDSLLILLAYYKWGEDCPKHLIGDFAFMIWDEKERKMFGARDFSGARTLYYFNNGKQFGFCTAIKPFFSLPYIKKELNEEWLADYLTIPGMHDTVDASRIAFKNIILLPPSNLIVIYEGNIKTVQYCKLNTNNKLHLKNSIEYEEAFRDVFQKAVRSRVRTRKNVGSYLSGGLDSGSVVSFASKTLSEVNKSLNTYSYIPVKGFQDWTPKHRIADESPSIKAIVNNAGNIKDSYLDFEGLSPYTEINDWLDLLETPYKFFENSFWIKGIYEEASKQDIGVLLNGARGNWTVSWGPALDYYSTLLKKLRWFKLNQEMKMYSEYNGVSKAKVFSVVRKRTFPFIYNLLYKQQSGLDLPILINPKFSKVTNVLERMKENNVDLEGTKFVDFYQARQDHFNQLVYWNINGISTTKLSLRYSLWDRDPTNDLRVIRFCLTVPEKECVKNGYDRALIRNSTKDILPDNIRLNQEVRGIQGSDGIYRMKPNWRDFIGEAKSICGDSKITNYLNSDAIAKSIKNLEEPKINLVYSSDFKILMRAIIISRFIHKNFERG